MSYVYRHVEIVRVIDGDTVRLDVDMGNSIFWATNFRLNGIDAVDVDKVKKDAAAARLIELLINGVSRIETFKPDKFGRWLADIYVAVDGGEMLVNRMMITEGFAIPYFGGKKTQ